MGRFARARLFFLLAALGGCATPAARDETAIDEKLARVGLEIIREEEAWVPAEESGKYVPCRVLPGFHESSPLPPHPAGYLIVGVAGEEGGAREIREAIARWKPGETLDLRVRRNPYRSVDSEWWERRVPMILPER